MVKNGSIWIKTSLTMNLWRNKIWNHLQLTSFRNYAFHLFQILKGPRTLSINLLLRDLTRNEDWLGKLLSSNASIFKALDTFGQRPGPYFMALLTAEFCPDDHDSPLLQAPSFCVSLVCVECLVTRSTHAHKPKFVDNLWNTLEVIVHCSLLP